MYRMLQSWCVGVILNEYKGWIQHEFILLVGGKVGGYCLKPKAPLGHRQKRPDEIGGLVVGFA